MKCNVNLLSNKYDIFVINIKMYHLMCGYSDLFKKQIKLLIFNKQFITVF